MENPELMFLFESLAGQHVFFGELPVKMQERGSQQTGCLLFTVGQIDSVRPGLLGPGSRWSVLNGVPPCILSLPSFYPPTPPTHTQTRLALAASSSEWLCLPSTNCKPPKLWSHQCEPMNNTCFLCRRSRRCQSWPQLYLSSVAKPSPTHKCVHPRAARCKM